ncbi:MAG: PAS domain S-box protein [Nannocystaceae bacterium]|nr:PAS domain S-box protein [Nannocystaceae bacterium]
MAPDRNTASHGFIELLRHLPIAAAVLDRELRCLAHTPTWPAAHGAPADSDLSGRVHLDVVPALREGWAPLFAACLEGATQSRDVASVDGDGTRRHLRWLVAPWRDAGGQIAGLVVSAEDRTEQEQTRKRLGEHEAAFRDLFASSPLGLNLCRMDGLWLHSNEAFLRIIGYSAAEADGGLTYWQLTPRKYDADEAVQLETLRTTRRYGPYEKEFIRKDGTLVPVRLHGFLIERDGEDLIWSVIEDMTEQRALQRDREEQRLHAIQASKLATLGEMAAGFAHEINNPLGIVELYVATLEDSIDAGDMDAVREAIHGIREAAVRAGQIVRGLSRFSRRSHGERALVDTRSLVEEALGLCRPRIAAAGVTVGVDAPRVAVVSGDAIQLSQVLVNLVNNAVDAARDTPQPWVRVRVEREADAPFVRIAVEDSGPPLPAGAEERIFEPFFTTKRVGEGTGLGLSVSRTIIDAHDGTLTLDRSADCTRFVVRLPEVQP